MPTVADLVSERLRFIRVRSAFVGRIQYRAPWGVTHLIDEGPSFHIVIEGSCLLSFNGQPPTRLTAGDIVVMPRGCAHTLMSSPDAQATDIASIIDAVGFTDGVLSYGGSGERTWFLCGYLSIEGDGFARDTLASVPDVVVILRHDEKYDIATAALMPALLHELEGHAPGRMEVIYRLSDLLFLQALRPHLETPFFKSDQDGPVAAALGLMHKNPEQHFSLDSLAQSVAVSRSVLSRHFRESIGLSPMQYLAHYRSMRIAALLETTDLALKEIAELTGYDGDISLSKAFRRWMGESPGGYRRRIRAERAEFSADG